jgi:hypothetical protein
MDDQGQRGEATSHGAAALSHRGKGSSGAGAGKVPLIDV